MGLLVGVGCSTITSYERLYYFPSPETAEKIADALKIDIDQLFPAFMDEYSRVVRSGRKVRKDDAFKYASKLNGKERRLRDKNVDPDKRAWEIELKDKVQKALECLPPFERKVIWLRYGLLDGYPYSLEEIGRLFGVTRAEIWRIESNALRKLQRPEIARDLVGFLD